MSLCERSTDASYVAQSLRLSDDVEDPLVELVCTCDKTRQSHSTYRLLAWYSSAMQVLFSLVLLAASVLYIVASVNTPNLLFRINIGLGVMCNFSLVSIVSVAGVIGIATEKPVFVFPSVILW